MKKIFFVLPLLFIFALPVVAAKNEAEVQRSIKTSPLPAGNSVQNQNEGEDSELQIKTQEQESSQEADAEETDEDDSQNRNENALEKMSEVGKEVQKLLQVRISGGIGEQVREIAQEQNQVQTQTQEQIKKLESRKGAIESLFGPDYGAIKNLKALLEQNQLRIQQLEQLQKQLTNQGDKAVVQATIQALIQEKTSLQALINAEEQTKSLLGWLFKLLAR